MATLSATQFIIQRLREYDPNRPVGPGSAWYELMVAPQTAILQPLLDDIARLDVSQTIAQVLESSDPNGFSEDVVDALLSNLLVTRRLGNRGTTVVRLRFYSPQAFEAGARSLTFTTTDGLKFVNVVAQFFTLSQVNVNFDGQFYYVDIPVESTTEGSSFNVGAGDIASMEDEPANVVDIANTSAVTDGVTRETNLELIARAKQEITVRALVTGGGIFSTITENFTSIRDVAAIGMGDDEMMRDIIYNAHVGGYVDAWLKPQGVTEATWEAETGLVADTSREVAASAMVAFDTPLVAIDSIVKNLPHEDLAPGSVVVTNATGSYTYVEGADYTIDYSNGTITPVAGGDIAHYEPSPAVAGFVAVNTFGDPAASFFTNNLSPGDKLVLNKASYGGAGGSEINDGIYTLSAVGANHVDITSTFPQDVPDFADYPADPNAGAVGYAVYGRVVVSYSYYPTSIEFRQTARTGRDDYTITNVPMLRVKTVEVLDPISGEPTGLLLEYGGGWGSGGWGSSGWGMGQLADWRVRVAEPNERFSVLEEVFLDFDPAHKGVRVAITYEYSPDVADVHTYVRDPSNRVVASDLLPKHMIPAFFNADLAYEVFAADAATTTTTMQAAIDAFLHTLPSGEEARLELSDLVDIMYDAGAVKVTLPITAELEVHNTDGSIRVVVNQDVLTVPTVITTDPTDRPLSARTAHPLPGTISLTQSPVNT